MKANHNTLDYRAFVDDLEPPVAPPPVQVPEESLGLAGRLLRKRDKKRENVIEAAKKKSAEDAERMSQEAIAALVCYGLVTGIVLFGFFLTQSKGGIGALMLGGLLLILLLSFGKTIWKRRRLFGILVLLLIVVATGFIIHFGTQHGRLPGGNSMLNCPGFGETTNRPEPPATVTS